VDDAREEELSSATRRGRLFARARHFNVPLATILTVVGVVVGVYLAGLVLYRLRDILLLMLVGGFVAMLLNPVVNRLEHTRLRRRGLAVAIVTVVSVVAFIGLAVAFGYPLVNSTTHLANALPAYVAKAEKGQGWIGHLLKHYHVQHWLSQNSSKLISFAQNLSKPALALGRGAVTILFALVTMFFFVVLLLLEGPKMRRFILDNVAEEHAERFVRIASHVAQATAGYMLGNMLTSLIAGSVIFVTLLSVSVPFALLWGLWVALVDFIPEIGGALAGIPTILFAFVHSLAAGIITIVVFVVYTNIENHVLNPFIMSRTVKINPLWIFVSVLVAAEIGDWIGGPFGGFVAVLLAVPLAATVHVLLRELWDRTSLPAAPG
jgi:predicted PurR-regulated permease PerM